RTTHSDHPWPARRERIFLPCYWPANAHYGHSRRLRGHEPGTRPEQYPEQLDASATGLLLAPSFRLYAFYGYALLFASFVLALRALVLIFQKTLTGPPNHLARLCHCC